MTATSRLVIEISSEAAQRNAELVNQELQRMTTQGNNAAGSMENLGNEAGNTAEELDGAGKAVRTLVGLIGGMAAVSKAISLADEYSQMASRIRNATESAEEYQLVQDRLLQTANNTFRPLKEAQEVYLGTADTLKDLGYTTNQALDIADSLSYSFVLNATEADKAASALDQYSKSMITGTVSSDAFIAMTGAADNIITDLAKHTGKSAAEIKKLGVEGKISLTDLNETLRLTTEQNLKLAQGMSTSVADGFQAVTNSLTAYLGKGNEAYGVTGTLASGLGFLAKHLETVMNIAGAAGLGYFAGSLAKSSVALYANIVALKGKLLADGQALIAEEARTGALLLQARAMSAHTAATVLAAERDVAATVGTNGHTAAMIRLTEARLADSAAMRVQTAAQVTHNASMAAGTVTGAGLAATFLSPVGLAIGAATVASAFYFMSDSTDDAGEALEWVGMKADEAKEKFLALTAAQQAYQVDKLTAELADQDKALQSASQNFRNLLQNIVVFSEKNGIKEGAAEAAAALRDMDNKTISAAEAYNRLNGIKFNDDYRKALNKNGSAVADNQDKTDKLRNTLGLMAGAQNGAANATDKHTTAINKQSEALKKYLSQQNSTVYENAYATKLMQLGDTPDLASELAKRAQLKKSDTGVGALTKTEIDDAKEFIKQQTLRNSLQQQYTDSIKAGEKATKDSQKTEDKAADKRRKDYEDLVAQYRTESEAIDDLYKKQGILATSYGTLAEKKALIAKIDAAGAYEQAQARIRKEQEYVGFFEAYNDQAAIIYQRYEWEKELAAKNTKFTEKEQKNIFNALVESQAREVALINNKNAQEILSTKQSYLSQADFMTERYRLEREEIEKTIGKSKELKDALIAASKLKEFEERQAIKNAASSLYQDKNVTQMQRNDPNGYAKWNMQNEYDTNSGAMDTAFANQKSAIVSDPLVSEADKNAQLLEAEKQYLDAKEAMNTEYNERQKEMLIAQASVALSSTESMFSSLTDIAATTAGKQSKAYKAMFTIQKIASIAQSSLAISTGIAQAAALPFPANIGAMASVAAATAGIISDIQGIHMEGFANGGYTGAGGKYETAGLVHKGEVVWSQEDIKRSGGVSNVEAMRKGNSSNQPIVNVNVIQGQGVKVTTTDDGQGNITVEAVRQEIANMLPNLVAGELANQNSRTSKALKQNFNVAPKR